MSQSAVLRKGWIAVAAGLLFLAGCGSKESKSSNPTPVPDAPPSKPFQTIKPH